MNETRSAAMLNALAAGLLLIASLATQLGCAGGRGDVRFDSLRYPVSMSGYIYDPKNRALSPKSLDVVAEFEHEARL